MAIKKKFSGTDIVILFSLAVFASIFVIMMAIRLIVLPTQYGATLLLIAMLNLESASEGITSKARLLYCLIFIFGLVCLVMSIVYAVLTLRYASKDKAGKPSIIVGSVLLFVWATFQLATFKSKVDVLTIFTIIALTAFLICLAFSIKKYNYLKRENEKKLELNAENA